VSIGRPFAGYRLGLTIPSEAPARSRHLVGGSPRLFSMARLDALSYEYRTRDGCRSELHPVGARPSAMTGRPERINLLAVADAGIDNKVRLQDCHCKATS